MPDRHPDVLAALLDERFAALHNDLELVRAKVDATLTEVRITNGRVTRLESLTEPLVADHDHEMMLKRISASRRKRLAWALGVLAGVATIASGMASFVSSFYH